MSSVIVEDTTKPKSYQLFTAGTAELVRYGCNDLYAVLICGVLQRVVSWLVFAVVP